MNADRTVESAMTLAGASYVPLRDSEGGNQSPVNRILVVAKRVGLQIAELMENTGLRPEAVVVCSTSLKGLAFMNGPIRAALLGGIEESSGIDATMLVNAYECAGWGFSLRFLFGRAHLSQVILVIVDYDPFDFTVYHHHPLIGFAGFGSCALGFVVERGRPLLLRCSGPLPNAGFTHLTMFLREQSRRHANRPTFVPFVVPNLERSVVAAFPGESLRTNRIDAFGHCFGSDPWVGIIDAFSGRRTRPALVNVGSNAMAGYLSTATVGLRDDTWLLPLPDIPRPRLAVARDVARNRVETP